MTYPTVKLKPKVNAKRIRHGFPWVYANEVALDRRTKSLPAGSFAQLVDNDQTVLGLVTVNPNSKIFARVMSPDPAAIINQAWIAEKLTRAAGLRDQIYDAPYYRLIHAEADGLPSVIIDRFGDLFVVQPNAAWADNMQKEIADALVAVCSAKTVIINGTGRARTLEGLEEHRSAIIGQFPDSPIEVPMNGATYFADVRDGQKTGLFFDQRPNHAFAQKFAKDAQVLDVFSHVGGFGLAALAAGAKGVTCVDGSQAALDLAQRGADHLGQGDRFTAIKADAFASLEDFTTKGQKFDMVICDPPAFAPSKTALSAGLRAYERVAKLAAGLVQPNGVLVLCSCSHAADLDKFRASSLRGIGRAGRYAQLLHTGFAGPDHPQHPALAESIYLKSLFFRLH